MGNSQTSPRSDGQGNIGVAPSIHTQNSIAIDPRGPRVALVHPLGVHSVWAILKNEEEENNRRKHS